MANLLTAPPHGAVEHFNNLRGKDGYKDFEKVVIVGRELPPLAEVERQARGLWYDHPKLLESAEKWTNVSRQYRMRNAVIAANVQAHPDPRMNLVLQNIREAEIEQAVDRLRLVHTDREKRVLILTNTPTQLIVNRVVSWEELKPTRIEMALREDRFAPLSASECFRLRPDLWPSVEAAKKALQREHDKGDMDSVDISYRGRVPLFQVEYRLEGQDRGRPYTAWASGPEPEKLVAKHVGPNRIVSITPLAPSNTNLSVGAT